MLFRSWAMENGYIDIIGKKKGHKLSIDRINSELGYNPNNCQWITHSNNSGKASSRAGSRPVKINIDEASEIVEAIEAGVKQIDISTSLKVHINTVYEIFKNYRRDANE